MKFRYLFYFSVSLELTLEDNCLDQANNSGLNNSFGEDLLHHNPCIITIILFLSFDIFVLLVTAENSVWSREWSSFAGEKIFRRSVLSPSVCGR